MKVCRNKTTVNDRSDCSFSLTFSLHLGEEREEEGFAAAMYKTRVLLRQRQARRRKQENDREHFEGLKRGGGGRALAKLWRGKIISSWLGEEEQGETNLKRTQAEGW
jgi:hypothetical protein